MPISNGMNLARLLGSSTNIRSQYVAASVSTLADMDALIAENRNGSWRSSICTIK